MSEDRPRTETPSTDFHSLASPEYDVRKVAESERERKRQKTDYHSLKRELPPERHRYQRKSITDFIIDAVTPFLIFWMVFAVIFFLLDVRFIYTEVEHTYLRVVAFSFVMGVVALNRLVARQGSEESVLYIAGLALAIALYTFSVSGRVGSVAKSFLDSPYWATLFNMVVVGVLWWVVNRLVHESCIDENQTAGDVGILTGTLRNLRQNMRPEAREEAERRRKQRSRTSRRAKDHILEDNELEAFDPHEWKEPEENKPAPLPAPTKRLATRHPGISILLFSIPALTIFALGLPVLLRGGPGFVLAGHFYVGLYTVCALMLLMLTSLAGIRQYFRNRRVRLPSGIGPFWAGLGTLMVLFVVLGALQLPKPLMPTPAYIEDHEIDYWTRDSTFELTTFAGTAADRVQQTRIIERLSQVVLGVMVLFAVYSAVRGLSALAAAMGRRRDLFPRWMLRFFNGLDRLLERVVSLPEPKPTRHALRLREADAQSTRYTNPMKGEGVAETESDARRYIAHAYDALCALAADAGVPRHPDQTPYEFLQAFPKELDGLRGDAKILTDLYVRSAYSELPTPDKVLDRLRGFWTTYDKVRRRFLK